MKVGVRFVENENKEKHSSVQGVQRDLEREKQSSVQDVQRDLEREKRSIVQGVQRDLDKEKHSSVQGVQRDLDKAKKYLGMMKMMQLNALYSRYQSRLNN